MKSRGLVVSPHFVINGQALHFPGLVGLEADALRQYLLYWDRLEWPSNNLINIGSSPDVAFLESEGIMTRSRIVFHSFSGPMSLGYITAQMEAFRQRSIREPGQWAIGQTAAQFFSPAKDSVPTRAIEIELYEALPVPPSTVSLQDVLEFKNRRVSELQSLRAAMDALYLDVIGAADIPRAKDSAINRLESSIRDLNAAATESWGSQLLKSLKVEVRIPDAIASALGGAAVSLPLGINPVAGLAIGAAASAIKFEPRSLRTPSLPAGLHDFAYLYHAQRELAV